MISIEKDLNGRYRCMKCHRLIMLHECLHFVCKCNELELEKYNIDKANKNKNRLYSKPNYII